MAGMAKKKTATNTALQRADQAKRYQDRKEDIQADRKRRYREDDEYRQRMRDTAKRHYWLGKRAETPVGQMPAVTLADIPPRGTITVVVENMADVRNCETVSVPVYTTAALEKLLGRNPATIREWLKLEVLPEPYWRGRMVAQKVAKGANPRLFTADEMEAIESCRAALLLPARDRRHPFFARCMHEKFATLIQGLVPKYG